MRKEELDDHSPGPSPDDVIISLDNKFVTTWLKEMGQFQYKSKELVAAESKGSNF